MGLLQPVADRHPAVGELRGKGLMIGLEFVGADGYAPDPQTASAVLEGARERGLLVGKGGLHGNCLRIAPPLSLAEDEAAEGAAILAEALDAALS
jgi:4-aminobutyrate aminotransferase